MQQLQATTIIRESVPAYPNVLVNSFIHFEELLSRVTVWTIFISAIFVLRFGNIWLSPFYKYKQGCLRFGGMRVWASLPNWSSLHWSCIWILNKVPINQYSWIQNQWTQSSCPGVSITASNLLFTSGWINVRPFGILFTPGYCSLRDIVHFGPMCGCAASRRWAPARSTLWTKN